MNRHVERDREYLIVSDLHLADEEDHEDGWKRHKHSRFFYDRELAELFGRFCEDHPRAQLTLILAGDILDFDLVSAVPEAPPWPVSRRERKCGLDATAAKSAYKCELMLASHPDFMDALARFADGPHQRELVYILGNHDRELHFPEVQAVFRAHLARAAARVGADPARVDAALTFEPWFFHVPGVLYVEHGQQYDRWSSFDDVLDPVEPGKGEEVIALPMGDLSNRFLLTRMGSFNPHQGDFILGLFEYVAHWWRHYATRRRKLVMTWMLGSLAVLFATLGQARRCRRRGHEGQQRALKDTADAKGIPLSTLEAIDAMRRRPVTTRPWKIIRELWLDRLALAGLMTAATVALALVPIPLWVKLMVPLTCFPLLFLLYEAVQNETIFDEHDNRVSRAREISQLLEVPVVAMGHTHDPSVTPLARGVQLVDTGTWAPQWEDGDPESLTPGLRNYARVSASAASAVDVSLHSGMATCGSTSSARVSAHETYAPAAAPPGVTLSGLQ